MVEDELLSRVDGLCGLKARRLAVAEAYARGETERVRLDAAAVKLLFVCVVPDADAHGDLRAVAGAVMATLVPGLYLHWVLSGIRHFERCISTLPLSADIIRATLPCPAWPYGAGRVVTRCPPAW